MSLPNDVTSALGARGELVEVAPGLVALRGAAALLFRTLDQAITALCLEEASEEWRVPSAIDFATLARADYFASFPQWLTLASHLTDDEQTLRQIAGHTDPGSTMNAASVPPKAALNPAVCFHIYAALQGTTVGPAVVVTAQSECWRHEGSRHAPLERQWAFTMREVVCVGAEDEARAFLVRCRERVADFARALDLDPTIVAASDPFFAPAARAKQLLQRLKELKHELLLPIDADRRIAASSFNLHDTFFGAAFDITLPNGQPATTACVAFGLERWLLAFAVRHGIDAGGWPAICHQGLGSV